MKLIFNIKNYIVKQINEYNFTSANKLIHSVRFRINFESLLKDVKSQ